MKKRILFFLIASFMTYTASSQVLISLIFGDKLNSGKIEFGLDGGANWSNISNLENAKYRTGFHLGFYFDFRLKESQKMFIHTGVIVKSNFGVTGLSPYSLSNPNLDTVFASSTVERKLSYFNVPITFKYKFYKQLYIEAGPQLGLLYKAYDIFTETVNEKNDLSFTNDIRDQYHRLDVGVVGGLGYHIRKNHGMNVGVRYYYGFVDILKNNDGPSQLNSSIYLFFNLPIGVGKAERKAAEKNQTTD